MVKNSLSNSTASLRGSSSSLSLRQAAATNAELEVARQKIKALEEEMGRMEVEKQNEVERLEIERLREVERLEGEKQMEKERMEEEKRREVERLTAEKERELERINADRKEEINRLLRTQKDRSPVDHAREKVRQSREMLIEAGLRKSNGHSDAAPIGGNLHYHPQTPLPPPPPPMHSVETMHPALPSMQLTNPMTMSRSPPPVPQRPYSIGSGLASYPSVLPPPFPSTIPTAYMNAPDRVTQVNGPPRGPLGYVGFAQTTQAASGQYDSRPRSELKNGVWSLNYRKSDGSIGTRQSPLPSSPPPPHMPKQSMSLFERYEQDIPGQMRGKGKSLITKALSMEKLQKEKIDNTLKSPEVYAQPFCDFLTENPTVWHAVNYFEVKLEKAGFQKLSERKRWNETLKPGGKYYTTRNGSSLIAFTVGDKYKSGNGVAMVAGHVDALTARLKPISNKKTSAGYVQLGIAPYAGALNSTWWDRDLGVGGRVLVQDPKTGKITTKLVKLGWPIARIPTLAPHFGIGMTGQENKENQMVPIIGLDNDSSSSTEEFANLTLGSADSFAATQPPKLVRAIAGELSITDFSSIINWELELYDTQPAQIGGLEKEFIFGGRVDDKVCSWAAIEGLLASTSSPSEDDGLIKLVGVFDDEEIGSLLRQGARGNFLPSVIERITESFAPSGTLSGANLLSQTYANSFLISADVTHAVNPNFLSSYLENHAPRLNVGLCVCADSNGHMTTDSVSTALLTRVAEKTGNKLQLFMIRNDSRSGGTVGPMLSSAMGVRAIDAGIPQLSMHSIRATIGNLDPGLGVKAFAGFFETFEDVDAEFE